MADFRFIARTSSGERLSGSIEADTEVAAARVLGERQLFPVEVVREDRPIERSTAAPVRQREIGIMYGQLADLLTSGVPLLRGLKSLIESSPSPRLTALVQEIHDNVADGGSLADAMRERPETFPLLHVAMVQAGESASFLEDVLANLSTFIERIDELRGRVRGALIYPAMLTLLGTVVMIGALVFFVPKFEPLLEGTQRPLPTQIKPEAL